MSFKTLVYSPDVRIVIEGTDVSADSIGGSINRITGGASSVTFTLSNKGLRYNNRFRRMDRVAIWMKRINWVLVFTGYLDLVPGLQLYPSTVTFKASCTIKRLLHMWWDPALDPSLALLQQTKVPFGELAAASAGTVPAEENTADDGVTVPPVTTPPTTPNTGGIGPLLPGLGLPSDTFDTPPATGNLNPADGQNASTQQKDTGLGNMLKEIMVKVGGWELDDVKVQQFPSSFLGYLEGEIPNLENLAPEALELFKKMFGYDEATGSSAGTGSGGGGLGESTFTSIGPPANGSAYSDDELVWIVKNGGWTGDDIAIGVAIIKAESGGKPSAVNAANNNGSVDKGLWQINTIHDATFPGENRFDPAVSTKLAREVYKGAGWQAWSTYSFHGTYAQHMDAARAAVARGGVAPPTSGATSTGTPSATPAPKAPTGLPSGIPGGGTSTGGTTPTKDPNMPNTAAMSIQDAMIAVVKYKFPGPNDGGVFTITSKSRGEPGSYHDYSENKAIDISNGGDAGTPEMKSLAQWIYENFLGKGCLELIHSPFNHNIGDDADVGDGMSTYYNPGTMAQHRNHVHWAMAGVVSADGTSSAPSVNGGAGGGSSASAFQNKLAKNIFTYMFNPEGFRSELATQLTGRYASINDEPLFKVVKAICEAGMREFQSSPDGKFLAFYPDYFGLDGTAPALKLEDVEMKDVRIDINDDALTTHVFTMGSSDVASGAMQSDIGYMSSSGVVTIEDEWLFKKATEGSYFQAEDGTAEDLLARYGVRPLMKQYPNIYQPGNPETMLLVAIKLFMQKWAEQYQTSVEFTFMPDMFPGTRVELVGHDLIVYVKSVTHNWHFEQGFSTSAQVMAPMSASRAPTAGL